MMTVLVLIGLCASSSEAPAQTVSWNGTIDIEDEFAHYVDLSGVGLPNRKGELRAYIRHGYAINLASGQAEHTDDGVALDVQYSKSGFSGRAYGTVQSAAKPEPGDPLMARIAWEDQDWVDGGGCGMVKSRGVVDGRFLMQDDHPALGTIAYDADDGALTLLPRGSNRLIREPGFTQYVFANQSGNACVQPAPTSADMGALAAGDAIGLTPPIFELNAHGDYRLPATRIGADVFVKGTFAFGETDLGPFDPVGFDHTGRWLLFPAPLIDQSTTVDVDLHGVLGDDLVTLAVTKEGTGSGTVKGAPDDLDCGQICAVRYQRSLFTFVALGPTATPGSRFVRWEGDCTGSGPCVVSMGSDRSVTAVFEPATELACSDKADNDGDGRVDHPADPACDSPADDDESGDPECGDRRSNDRDGLVDLADPGCVDERDTSEYDEVTVVVDLFGPGAVNGCDKIHCAFRIERGVPFDLHATERTPGAFTRWRDCPGVAAVAACSVPTDRDRRLGAEFDPVAGYAPIITLYPGDKASPADPGSFVRRSRLMWFNDQGNPRPCRDRRDRFVVDPTPNLARIRSGRYRHRLCWTSGGGLTLKRPDPMSFTSQPLTAPAAKGDRRKKPPGRFGFYLDVDDEHRAGIKPADHSYTNAPNLYFEHERARYVVYWFFFAYNHRRGDKHEGDWEHLVLRLDDHWRAAEAAYYNHLCDPVIHPWTLLQQRGWITGDHPHVYIARGGHGAYPNVGKTIWTCWGGATRVDLLKGLYDVRTSGPRWRPWLTGGLRNAASQRWYDLGVGWGREGGIGWGPVGPGRHKSGAVPDGW
jgi:hypothetical protein